MVRDDSRNRQKGSVEMGLFSKKQQKPAMSQRVDPSLPDGEWMAASSNTYQANIEPYYGSPETMAQGANDCLAIDDVGTALFFYRKSIDILHSQYLCIDPPRRDPNDADAAIVNGFVSTLRSVKSDHPSAPVDETVREVTHRFRTIAGHYQRLGVAPDLYLNALNEMPSIAPEVDISTVLG